MVLIAEESTTTVEILQKTPPSAEPGCDSDAYETASDTELNDAGDEEQSNNDGEKGQQEMEQHSESSHLTEKEASEQANDAKLEGNTLFKDGFYDEALVKYELALQLAPHGPSSVEIRSILHANCAACFSKLGKFEETTKECTKALELNPTYIKVLLRRAEAHEKLDKYEEAIADMTKILELDQSHYQARRAIIRLKPLADEKREKMKEEMIGKLKEMGNSILGHFGMSVDNFKAVKDPTTGSYSVSFQN
ncbi:hypothetical protein ACJIZ3_010047 [Penstemon smallii]|uniref:Tetratricopeptide repeat protein 1 n=1 Tax=Penstemon smallii TaxID=265156 RepID=A0ABD3TE87_9LAMI